MNETFVLTTKSTPQSGGKVEESSYEIESNSKISTYEIFHIPAIKEEPYISTINNYKARIEFELLSINYGQGQVVSFVTS